MEGGREGEDEKDWKEWRIKSNICVYLSTITLLIT